MKKKIKRNVGFNRRHLKYQNSIFGKFYVSKSQSIPLDMVLVIRYMLISILMCSFSHITDNILREVTDTDGEIKL